MKNKIVLTLLLTCLLICCFTGNFATATPRSQILRLSEAKTFAAKTSEGKISEGKTAEGKTSEAKTSLPQKDDSVMLKDETVYVITDATGKVKQTIVSDWLRNITEADVNNFILNSTITFASNDFFNHIEIGEFPSLDQWKQATFEIINVFEKLVDGSSEIDSGMAELLEASKSYANGVKELSGGSAELNRNMLQLHSGTTELSNGMQRLNDGLNMLNSKNAELNTGATQVFEKLLYSAQTQLTNSGITIPKLDISNYAEILGESFIL